MNDVEKKLYIIAEAKYLEVFERKGSITDNMDLYPFDWFEMKNYHNKIEILIEAIKNKILIKDTEHYRKYQDLIRL